MVFSFLPSLVDFFEINLILFLLGFWGLFVVRKNLIMILIAIELLLLSVNLNFVVFSVFLDDLVGQVFALSILTVAAAESAIGLAILVVFYRIRGVISIDFSGVLKG
jgi:NADH-quinone oxidoreductase subunit K